MPTKYTHFPSLFDLLQDVENDYRKAQQQFEKSGVAFVDIGEKDPDAGKRDVEKQEYRNLLLRRILVTADNVNVPALAVIVNVAGRPKAFPDVLRSLAHQSFLKERPDRVEVVLVQDGSNGVLDEPVLRNVLEAMAEFHPNIRRQAFRLADDRESRGRGTARNVGIWFAHRKTDVIMFLDDSMILYDHFVAEQMLRHKDVTTPIALLGFKENRKFKNFDEYKSQLDQMKSKRPDFCKDWKWTHILEADEATNKEGGPGFDYEGTPYEIGSTISYMKITDNFKALHGNLPIGHRALPMFFHTGLTSVKYASVLNVGGFEKAFDAGKWGFEDSYLGLLLAVNDVKLVPCPSSVAYKVEIQDEEVNSTKELDIKIQREQFWELASMRDRHTYNEQKLKQQIDELTQKGLLQPVPLDRSGQPSSTRTDVPPVKRDEKKAGRSRGRLIELQSRSIPAWNSELIEWPGLQRGHLVAKIAPCRLDPDSTLLSAFDRLNENRQRKGFLPHYANTRFRLIGPPRPIANVVALDVAPMDFVMRALLYDSDVPDEIKASVHHRIESAAKKVAKRRRNSHPHFNERSAIPLGVEIVLLTSDHKTLLRNRGKDVLTGAQEWDISFGGYCGIDDLLPDRDELDPFRTVENELKNEIGTILADPRKIRLTGLHRNSKSGAVDLLGFWEVQIDCEHLAALLADKYPGSTKIFRTTKKAVEQYVWDTQNLIVDFDAGAIRAALGGTLCPTVLMPQGYTALDLALRAFHKHHL